jgi:hypothetical protein
MLGHDSRGMETQVDCSTCNGYGGWEDMIDGVEDDYEPLPDPITCSNLGVF